MKLPKWFKSASENDVYAPWLVIPSLVIIIALIILFGFFTYKLHKLSQYQTSLPPVGLNIEATPAKEVKLQPRIDKPIKSPTVKVYPAAVKNAIKLPEVVQDNPALDVIASNQIPADDHPRTITTLINTDTGESQTYVRRDPLPWLAWNTQGEAGLYMGIKNGTPAARLEARQGFVQVKALHFGVIGSIDQPLSGQQNTDYFIGAGVWARW